MTRIERMKGKASMTSTSRMTRLSAKAEPVPANEAEEMPTLAEIDAATRQISTK